MPNENKPLNETEAEREAESPAPIPTETNEPPVVSRQRAARRLRRAEVYYGVALAAFAVLALLARFNSYFGWDLRAARFLQNLPVPGLHAGMRVVSVPGDDWIPYALTAVTVLIFLVFNWRSEAAGMLFSAGAGAIVNFVLKTLIARPRPSSDLVQVFRELGSKSFPSGHVSFYVCYFGFLFFVAYALLPRGSLSRRAALVICAAPVALVGLSRVYLGEHWPSDVFGAYLASGLWLALSLNLYRRWKQNATFHEDRPR
ncbi:MAG TPA: phosphatase PAP2 family protein [Pyrinomonadaceae bacterium]|jgi:undecaprenyl-diphosphatase|nr:phosphatase PAP2 family protein [Pyrinomonadaceae bacterium]